MKVILEQQLNKLTIKLEKDISYLGILKYQQLNINKTTKDINYDSVKSIRIKKNKNDYYISFTYVHYNEYKPTLLRLDNNKEITTVEELALYVKELTDTEGRQVALDYLSTRTLGIDRGVIQRVALSDSKDNGLINTTQEDNEDNNFLSYSDKIKALITKLEKGIKYHNRELKRRTTGSRGYNYSLKRTRKLNKKIANIKLNENHQVTHDLVMNYDYPIYAIEKLNVKGMTKKPYPKVDIEKSLTNKYNLKLGLDINKLNDLVIQIEEYNKENKQGIKYSDIVGDYQIIYAKNKSNAKAGLNKSLLRGNLGQFAIQLEYKSVMNGKLVLEVPAAYSSQECNNCGNIDSESRIKTKFCCVKCGHKDHADINASKVIAGRVYKALMHILDKIVAKDKLKLKKNAKVKQTNIEEVV